MASTSTDGAEQQVLVLSNAAGRLLRGRRGGRDILRLRLGRPQMAESACAVGLIAIAGAKHVGPARPLVPEIAVVDGIMGALDGPVPRIGRGARNAAAFVALVL